MPTSVRHEYEPLEDPALQIRLLEISDGGDTGEEPIEWKLSTFEINQAPPYHAISYTWGPEQPTEDILLNTGSKSIRRNCADVLRQLVFFRTSRYYWLDALCINQTDTQEKTGQVAMMGDIFRKAEHVLICLGEYDDDGEYAVHVLQNTVQTASVQQMKYLESVARAAVLHRNGLHSGIDLARFARSLAALAHRPYFKRVWVVQEMHLARDASVCCRTIKIPARYLRRELLAAHQYLEDVLASDFMNDLDPDHVPQKLELEPLDLLDSIRQSSQAFDGDNSGYRRLHDPHSTRLSGVSGDMSEVLYEFSALDCQDPRDTVYGALALIDWDGKAPIAPDYNKTPYELAKEILITQLDTPHAVARKILVVLQNLRISERTAEIREGIALRQQLTKAHLMDQDSVAPSPSPKNKIERRCPGWQLSELDFSAPSDGTDQAHVLYIDRTDSVTYIRAIFMIPQATQPGDWILELASMAKHLPGSKILFDYLVIRECGNFYAVVGQAVCLSLPEKGVLYEQRNEKPCFSVLFDPDDLMVLIANQARRSTAPAVVKIPICHKPFSTFARHVEHRHDSLPDLQLHF